MIGPPPHGIVRQRVGSALTPLIVAVDAAATSLSTVELARVTVALLAVQKAVSIDDGRCWRARAGAQRNQRQVAVAGVVAEGSAGGTRCSRTEGSTGCAVQ